jgi:hypothetical protein
MALALGTRRSTIAAVACDMTVRDLLQAARTGDRELVFELLAPSTRARLDAQAARATDLVGAATRYTAKDLISIGASDPSAIPTHITVIEQRADTAVVEIVSAAGRSRVQLLKIDGRWRVDLPGYGATGAP